MEVVTRSAAIGDAPALAALKAEWTATSGGAVDDDPARLVEAVAAFMVRLGDAVSCRIAETDGRAIGAAWLVLTERVPSPGGQDRRLTADVQSVYVTPSARGRGVATRLIRELCEEADRCGAERTTVHANDAALLLYARAGFRPSPVLLQRGPE